MTKTLFAALAAILFGFSGLNAQQRINVPDSFTGTKICLNLPFGKLVTDTKKDLAKKGVDPVIGFVDRDGDCRLVDGPFIRISVHVHEMQASSESSSSSISGHGYSSSGSGSRSGTWIAADAIATLARVDGTYVRIGFNSEAFQAGSVSVSSSNSGPIASSSGSFSRTTPEDQATADAMKHALHDLLGSKKHWVPGVEQIVADAFAGKGQPIMTRRAKPTSQAEADKILAEAAALREQAQALRDEAAAKKEKVDAEKDLKKAQADLKKASKK